MKTHRIHPQGHRFHDRVTLDSYEPFGNDFRDCAVLIFPGGGYNILSAQEGEGFAGLFQLHGFHSFVLNYRLGSEGHRHPAMIEDAKRAMRFVRSLAGVNGFDPKKIVVIGSSAGGHLAATLLTKWDEGQSSAEDPLNKFSCRPDLGVLCYPVISFMEHGHGSSRTNLLGENPPEALMAELSAELHVNSLTPPCFLWHTVEDSAVPVENALLFSAALRASGVPFECHIYQDGAHGLGMKDGHPWVQDLIRWLHCRLKK